MRARKRGAAVVLSSRIQRINTLRLWCNAIAREGAYVDARRCVLCLNAVVDGVIRMQVVRVWGLVWPAGLDRCPFEKCQSSHAVRPNRINRTRSKSLRTRPHQPRHHRDSLPRRYRPPPVITTLPAHSFKLIIQRVLSTDSQHQGCAHRLHRKTPDQQCTCYRSLSAYSQANPR